MLMLTTATGVAMVGGDGVDIMDTDHGDMGIGDARRGPLTSHPSLDLIPTLMPMLMLGMVIMATPGHGDMDMVDTTDHGDMDTGEGSKRYSYHVALGTGSLRETTSAPGQ